ncbi:MAG TPA: enoyl-CoA hydratase/isomerase family protein [Alphaproteobacteria bacterium]|nr:enoyl-CoA hydratase/isomerase family protein [Alphaproteobacteria bacterium]
MSETFTGKAVSLAWPAEEVALATLTRAREMNTLTLDLIGELGRALDIAAEAKARALIITGSGRAFCCGAHLDYFTDPKSPVGQGRFELRDHYLAKIAALFDRFETMAFPIIAAVNGYALGGGCEMAISSDFRLMSRTAKIGVPEVKLGAFPGAGGVQKLGRHIGRTRAIEWCLLGRHYSAEEADRAGLLFAVAEPDELMPAALKLADEIKALSPLAIAQAKSSVYVAEDVDLATARRFGLEQLSMLIGSSDWQEGMDAFHAKRPPKF